MVVVSSCYPCLNTIYSASLSKASLYTADGKWKRPVPPAEPHSQATPVKTGNVVKRIARRLVRISKLQNRDGEFTCLCVSAAILLCISRVLSSRMSWRLGMDLSLEDPFMRACVCVCVLCEGGREKRGGERVDWLTMKAVLIHTV